MKPSSTKITFDNGRGASLAGIVDMPADGQVLFAGVFAPCFTCTKESHAAHKVCRALALRGGAILRFDVTGIGGSGGNFADMTFSAHAQDIIAAARAMKEKLNLTPTLLVGHSIGGPAALKAALSLPEIKTIATIGSPPDPSHVVERLTQKGLITFRDDEADMIIAGHKITMKRGFVEDALNSGVAEATAAFRGDLFVFHAPHDDTVNIARAQTIAARAGGNAEVVPLSENATHLLERGTEDADFIAETLADRNRGLLTI